MLILGIGPSIIVNDSSAHDSRCHHTELTRLTARVSLLNVIILHLLLGSLNLVLLVPTPQAITLFLGYTIFKKHVSLIDSILFFTVNATIRYESVIILVFVGFVQLLSTTSNLRLRWSRGQVL